jgi:hypothetical protein
MSKYKKGDKVLVKHKGVWIEATIHYAEHSGTSYTVTTDDNWFWGVVSADVKPLTEEHIKPISPELKKEAKVASYDTVVKSEKVYQWRVPYPAKHTDVHEAWMVAESSYRAVYKVKPEDWLPDDALWFVPDANYVIIQFTASEVSYE